MWCGKGSTGDEREMAKKIAAVFAPGDQEVVYEGANTFIFYASMKRGVLISFVTHQISVSVY